MAEFEGKEPSKIPTTPLENKNLSTQINENVKARRKAIYRVARVDKQIQKEQENVLKDAKAVVMRVVQLEEKRCCYLKALEKQQQN